MTLDKLTLKLDENNNGTIDFEYDIYPIQSVELSTSKDAFSIAPPGLAPKDNILLGVSGMQADIRIDFMLWDDGSDRSNGTYESAVGYSTPITAPYKQAEWLTEQMHAPDFSARWELEHNSNQVFLSDEVFLESVEPTLWPQNSPKWWPCRMALRRGGSV